MPVLSVKNTKRTLLRPPGAILLQIWEFWCRVFRGECHGCCFVSPNAVVFLLAVKISPYIQGKYITAIPKSSRVGAIPAYTGWIAKMVVSDRMILIHPHTYGADTPSVK